MSQHSPVGHKPSGVVLALKVAPGAGRNVVGGTIRDAAGAAWLAVKVTAPPEGGRAKSAVLALLAKALGVPNARLPVGRRRLAAAGSASASSAIPLSLADAPPRLPLGAAGH